MTAGGTRQGRFGWLAHVPVRRLAGFLGLPLISGIAPLLVLPVLLKYIGAEAWAAIAIGQAVGTGSSTLVMLGWPIVGPALVAADPSRRRALYTDSVISRLAAFCVAAPAAMVIAAVLAPHSTWLAATLMALAQTMLGLAATWFFVGTGQPASIARFDTIPRVVATAVAALLVGLFAQAWLYPVTLLVSSAVLLVVVSARYWERGHGSVLSTTVRVVRSQWAAAGASAQYAVNAALPLTLVAAVAPAAVIGFAALDRITKFALFVIQPVGQAFQGWVAEPCHSPALRRRVALATTGTAGLVLAVGFAFLFDEALRILFVGKIAVPGTAVLVYALGIFLVALNTSLAFHFLAPLGMSNWLAIGVVFNIVLAGALIALLAPRFGVSGAAVAIVLAEAGVFLVQALAVAFRPGGRRRPAPVTEPVAAR